jgi:Secretion system C-terminal sorting domain
MKKITIISLAFTLFTSSTSFAQSIERQVIGSAGGSFSGTFQLDWTAGETVTNTASSGSVILTQGFQQPPAVPNAIKSISTPMQLKVYPVPTSNEVNLIWTGEKPNFTLQLYSISGALLYSGNWNEQNDFKIDLTSFSQGIYNLNFTSEKENFTVRLSKI